MTKKQLSLIVLFAGIFGFFFFTSLKGRYEVFQRRVGSSTSAPIEITLDRTDAHTIFFWGVDEETGFHWASLDAQIVLREASGMELISRQIRASGSEEKGGIKRAQNGFDETIPAGPSDLLLTIDLIQGDYIDVEIYAELPTWIHLAPGVSILVGLVGLVLYLKSRAAVA